MDMTRRWKDRIDLGEHPQRVMAACLCMELHDPVGRRAPRFGLTNWGVSRWTQLDTTLLLFQEYHLHRYISTSVHNVVLNHPMPLTSISLQPA